MFDENLACLNIRDRTRVNAKNEWIITRETVRYRISVDVYLQDVRKPKSSRKGDWKRLPNWFSESFLSPERKTEFQSGCAGLMGILEQLKFQNRVK